jgi:hypothetical protein
VVPLQSSALDSLTAHKLYHRGWIGLSSFPITCAFGNLSPISIAQMPVPVPISRMRIALSCGSSAKCNSSSKSSKHRWWFRSSLSCSFSSLGKLYAAIVSRNRHRRVLAFTSFTIAVVAPPILPLVLLDAGRQRRGITLTIQYLDHVNGASALYAHI